MKIKAKADKIIELCLEFGIVKLTFEDFTGVNMAVADYIKEQGIEVEKQR